MRQLLNSRITISRATSTQGNNLGIVTTNTALYSDVAASIQPATSSVQNFYAQRQIQITQTIFVADPLTIQRGDTVSDGTLTYEVKGWRDLSGRGRVFALDCNLTSD